MHRKLKNISLPQIVAVFFAVALQVQVTLFQSETYAGLRVSAADFLIPVAGLIIGFSLFLKHTAWPEWKKPFSYFLVVLMSVVFVMAFLNGYYMQDSLNVWALVNKLLGWFVLLGYLGCGAWLVTNYKASFLSLFVNVFCIFAIVTALGETINQVLKAQGIELGLRWSWEPICGLMTNRNAYAFLFTAASALITFYGFRKPGIMLYSYWILFPVIFIFNGARVLWLCVPFLLLVFVISDWKKTFKFIFPSIAVGIFVSILLFTPEQRQYFFSMPFRTTTSLIEYTQKPDDPEVAKKAKAFGNAQRINIMKDALDLIQKHPLQGAGLGSALYFQEKDTGARIDIIDSTPLWILTEMGLIGLLIFGWSYFSMAIALARDAGPWKNPENLLSLSVLIVLLCFGIFSLFHELLYTRFLWFFLGLALAIPKPSSNGRPDEQAP